MPKKIFYIIYKSHRGNAIIAIRMGWLGKISFSARLYLIFFYSLCEIKENPIGIQMILLEKKTTLILFLNVRNRKTSENSFKATGKQRSLFPLNCTIVSVAIETDGIAVKCHQQTWASKYMQVCFQRHRKTHVYILAKE